MTTAERGNGTPIRANIVVVGSLNMDLVARAERLPRPGETLAGESFATVAGGKGANQAVAAVRLGGRVAMIGCVGGDAYGERLRAALAVEGVDCHGVTSIEGQSSGVALIVVDAGSQNAIVVVAGANDRLAPEVVQQFDSLLLAADVVICQLEVPKNTVEHVLRRCRELGKTTILNPAPAQGPLPSDWYAWIDYLILNESEAAALSGLAVQSLKTAKAAAMRLFELDAGKVILTLGEHGALLADAQGCTHFPAAAVQAVDATAAGDTFVGAFAAALVRGKSARQAIAFGQAAAALSVTRAGAQPSIPYLNEIPGAV